MQTVLSEELPLSSLPSRASIVVTEDHPSNECYLLRRMASRVRPHAPGTD
ncbi:MAG TPA: hypothetical protein VN782_15260 [Usitatibacter sp.]|nr:hypothetical protein [Usitatibacter sp.]